MIWQLMTSFRGNVKYHWLSRNCGSNFCFVFGASIVFISIFNGKAYFTVYLFIFRRSPLNTKKLMSNVLCANGNDEERKTAFAKVLNVSLFVQNIH